MTPRRGDDVRATAQPMRRSIGYWCCPVCGRSTCGYQRRWKSKARKSKAAK